MECTLCLTVYMQLLNFTLCFQRATVSGLAATVTTQQSSVTSLDSARATVTWLDFSVIGARMATGTSSAEMVDS